MNTLDQQTAQLRKRTQALQEEQRARISRNGRAAEAAHLRAERLGRKIIRLEEKLQREATEAIKQHESR
jgi:hypothetical protein